MEKKNTKKKNIDNAEFDKLLQDTINSDVPVQWTKPKPPTVAVNANTATKRLRQTTFLKHLAKLGVVSFACKATGINVMTEQAWRKSGDTWYTQQFKNALQIHRDSIEVAVQERAIEGIEVPIIGRVQRQVGKDIDGNPIFAPEDAVIGTKVVKSDLLLMFHAKRHIPEYREKYEAPKDEGRPGDAGSPLARITIRLDMISSRNQQQIGAQQPLITEHSEVIDVVPESAEGDTV